MLRNILLFFSFCFLSSQSLAFGCEIYSSADEQNILVFYSDSGELEIDSVRFVHASCGNGLKGTCAWPKAGYDGNNAFQITRLDDVSIRVGDKVFYKACDRQ